MSVEAEHDPDIRPLTTASCLQLLHAEALGRIGFVSQEGVEIIPVGYRAGEGSRLFISSRPWGIVGQLAETDARCSFEVDHHSHTEMAGWSVLMHGVLSRLDRAGLQAYERLDHSLQAWPAYPHTRPVQFVPHRMTGRSVLRRS